MLKKMQDAVASARSKQSGADNNHTKPILPSFSSVVLIDLKYACTQLDKWNEKRNGMMALIGPSCHAKTYLAGCLANARRRSSSVLRLYGSYDQGQLPPPDPATCACFDLSLPRMLEDVYMETTTGDEKNETKDSSRLPASIWSKVSELMKFGSVSVICFQRLDEWSETTIQSFLEWSKRSFTLLLDPAPSVPAIVLTARRLYATNRWYQKLGKLVNDTTNKPIEIKYNLPSLTVLERIKEKESKWFRSIQKEESKSDSKSELSRSDWTALAKVRLDQEDQLDDLHRYFLQSTQTRTSSQVSLPKLESVDPNTLTFWRHYYLRHVCDGETIQRFMDNHSKRNETPMDRLSAYLDQLTDTIQYVDDWDENPLYTMLAIRSTDLPLPSTGLKPKVLKECKSMDARSNGFQTWLDQQSSDVHVRDRRETFDRYWLTRSLPQEPSSHPKNQQTRKRKATSTKQRSSTKRIKLSKESTQAFQSNV